MAEQINSGSGTQYPLIINSDGSINVSGVSATIAVGSEFYIPAGSVTITSMPAVSVSAGSEAYNYVDSGGTFVLEPFKREVTISGTISTSVTTGSESWIKNFEDLGSTVVIDNPASIGSYTTQTVDGTITVTGIETAGSLALQDVSIDTPETVGSLAVQKVAGSVYSIDFTTQLIQKIDYEDKMQPIYMGWAEAGTSTGSPNWQIRKNTFSGTQPELITGVLFGSGNTNFDKTWENRSGTNEEYS